MSAEFRRVILSDSDEENSPPATQSSTTAEASQPPQKRKRVRVDYEDPRKLNAEQYDDWWSKEKGNWIRDKVAENEEEAVVSYYYCRYKKRVGSACQRKLKVTMKDNSYEVAMSRGEHEHNDESVLTHEVKDLIRDLLADGRTPGQVRNKLSEKGFTPTLKQIENFVDRQKRKSGNHIPITDLELNAYCADNEEVPDDPNAAFVLGFLYEKDADQQQFIVIWTTANLWQKQKQSPLLQVDTTFGMLWNAFPIQMVGFSDAKKRFHPTAIAVISSECNWTYEKLFRAMEYHHYKPCAVLGDGAASITHATVTVFPDALRLMCWYHAQKAMSRNFKTVDSDTRKAVMKDIHDLQLCTDNTQFERAAELLREYWRTKYPGNVSVDEFSTYFFKEWICGPLRFWFEGASKFISTNNGLESINKQTKELDLDRKKVSFRSFVVLVEKVVNRWSALPDYNEVATEPKISPDTYVQAYQLSSARESRLQVGDDDGRFVLVPSSKNKDISTGQLLDMDERLKQMRVESWSEYIELRMGFYVIDPSGQWFRCTCPVGMKKSVCKHGLRLMCTKKLKTYPPDAKAVPNEPRRVKKRGRPKKEKPQIRF